MRNILNGRGAHPATANDIHRWTFDETANADPVQDIIGGADLVVTGNLQTDSTGWIGGYRTFAAAPVVVASGVAAGLDATKLVSTSWGLMVAFRLRAAPSVVTEVIGYTAVNAGTLASNDLVSLRINTSRQLVLVWQSGSNTVRTSTLTNYTVPRHRPVIVALTRTGATSVECRVNGRLIGSFAMVAASTGGTLCRWRMLTTAAGVGVALNIEVYSASFGNAYTTQQTQEMWRRAQSWAFANYVYHLVSIKDGAGVERDVSALEGLDFLAGVQGGWSVDDATETATISLKRQVDELSVSPLIPNVLNITNYTTGANSPLIDQGRQVNVYCGRIPLFVDAEPGDLILKYQGTVDAYDVGADPVSLECRDLAAYVIDDVMESDVSLPTTIGIGGCGTKAAPLENLIQDTLNKMHENIPTLWTEEPANLCMFRAEVERGPFMEKIRDFAGVKGWDVKTRFDPNTSTFRLGLFDPGRSRVDQDGVLSRRDYEGVKRYGISRINVRNIIRGNVLTAPDGTDAEGLDEELEGVLTFVQVNDLASQTKYGKRFMDIQQDSTAFIRGKPALTTMLGAALADLKDPTIEGSSAASNLFELEQHDILTLQGSRPVFAADGVVSVTSLKWDIAPDMGFSVTDMGLRGTPTAGADRRLRGDSRPSMGEPRGRPAISAAGAYFGVRSRDKVIAATSLLRGASLLRSGRFMNIPNGDFSTWMGGNFAAPDGWIPNAVGFFREKTIVKSGGASLGMQSGFGTSLSSQYLPVDPNTPYNFEVDWQGTGDDNVYLTYQWFDASRAYLSEVTSTPGSGFAAVPSTGGVWRSSVRRGVKPPSSARFCIVIIGYNGITTNLNVYVDRVQMLRCAFEIRVTSVGSSTTPPTWGGGQPPKLGFFENIPFAGLSAQSYLRGNCVATNITVAPRTGYGFLCLESGSYDAHAHIWIRKVSSSSLARIVYFQLVKNAVYDSAGRRTAGTIIASKTLSETFNIMPLNAVDIIVPGIDCEAGDTLTVDYCNEDPAADNVNMWPWTGPTEDESFFRVKQKLAE